MDEAGAILWLQEHISDAHDVIGKPVYGGEFGWYVDRSQASGTQTIAAFSSGTDGFVIDWGFSSFSRTGNPSQDGNGSLRCRINLRSSAPNGGMKKDFSTPQNFSGYQHLSAWVYVPFGAPSNLKAEFYVKSTSAWLWADGDDVTLVPGGWVQVKITPAQIASWGGNSADVRQVGVQVKRGTTDYNSFVYLDRFEAYAPTSSAMADRNRIYSDWLNQVDQLDGDGVGFWILNDAAYPDYDHFAVYYPEDTGTVAVLQDFSTRMRNKSGQPFDAPPWDACETVGTWQPGTTYSDANGISLSSAFVSQGTAALRLSYASPGFGKAFYENNGPGGAGLNQDWTGESTVTLDIYNPGGPTAIAIAVSTGAGWDWHESPTQALQTGWNTVSFSLTASNWKSAATGWQHTGTIANRNQVKRLAVGFFGYGGQSGAVHMDNIRLY
jgi:hypothetical protein